MSPDRSHKKRKKVPSSIPVFPKFRELTFADRELWGSVIADYPAVSSYSFGELMTYWSILDNVKVSQLNNNLVIEYFFPGAEEMSGLGIIGTANLDESICNIFDWQKENDRQPRLVHVPEFVIERCKYPEMFKFEATREYDECVLDLSVFSSISKLSPGKRAKIFRYLVDHDENKIEVREMDLTNRYQRELFLGIVGDWAGTGPYNGIYGLEDTLVRESIENAEELGDRALALYVHGEVQSILVYEHGLDDETILVAYARFNYEQPKLFEFAVYKYSQWAYKKGYRFVNIQSDFGLQKLRSTTLGLGPSSFVRKYTLEPGI